MTERAGHVPVSREPEVDRPAVRRPAPVRPDPTADRRRVDDRRIAAPADERKKDTGGRRGARRSLFQRLLGIAARDVLIVIGSLGAIVYAARKTHPIYANQPSLVASLTKAAPIAKAVLGPTRADTTAADQLVRSPAFVRDRANFSADLM